MTLKPGSKLGPYETLALIGAGGMGEVWKARDTRLGRDVAIKTSREQFTERFGREAHAVAALNHPNICTLHDVGPNYLVMEFIEGAPLKGPLPLDQALRYAIQICDALDAAHRKGITHRDLKPANILVTRPGVKLLDFGLAKVGAGVQSSAQDALTAITGKGEIVGTLYYMSPEQLQGKEADARSDIFSFGLVLYEMITGKRAFEGGSPASIIAAILERPAPSIASVAPPALDRVLQRCLAKEPDDRWQSARDLRAELEWIAEKPAVESAQPGERPISRRIFSVTGVGVIAAVAGWGWWRATRPATQPPKPLLRLSVDLGPDLFRLGDISFVISPDGSRLLHVSQPPGDKTYRFALRPLDRSESIPLPFHATGSTLPFFSPDSQWIGFFADNRIQKISVQGGGATALFDMPDFRGASWGENGFIVAAGEDGGLVTAPDTGGAPKQISRLEPGELTHRWPQILPGGKTVIFTASSSTVAFEGATIKAIAVDSGTQKTLVHDAYFGRYIPSGGTGPGAHGHLVYLHEHTLYAVAFDTARMELLGSPIPVLDDVAGNMQRGAGHFTFANTGTFVYLSSASLPEKWTLGLMEESGKAQMLISQPAHYTNPRFSPDGQRLAVSIAGARGQDIYIYERQREAMTRMTTSVQRNMAPVWAPDGKHLVYSNGSALLWIRADGVGDPQRLYAPGHNVLPFSFAPDGRRLAYWGGTDPGHQDIWTLPLDLSDPDRPRPGTPEPFVQGHGPNTEPAFSPDGRWIAYSSAESGTTEVYVRPFPGPGGKWQVSNGGGQGPMWSRSGAQLFYCGPDRRIMHSDYSTQATAQGNVFSAGKPRVWAATITFDSGEGQYVDIASDGKQFAVFQYPDETTVNLRAIFLLNLFDELRRRAPEARK